MHLALVAVDGESLGPIELSRPDWAPGSVIYKACDDRDLRMVSVMPSDDPEKFTILVVEPVPE